MRYIVDTDGENIKETLIFNGREYVVNTSYFEEVDFNESFGLLLKDDLYDDEDVQRMIGTSLDNVDYMWPILSSLADIAGAYENKLRARSK